MAPKAKQAARRAKAEAKAETGSNARNAARIVDNLPPLVTRKSTEVPVVCDMGLVEGIRLRRLVPLCAELVMETAAQGEADQEVALGLPDKARAAAAWICANNIERTIVFCSHQAEADEFALCLDPCVQEFSAGRVWVRAMHGGATCERPETLVAAFQGGDYVRDGGWWMRDGIAHRVLVTTDMLHPVIDFESVQAVVVLQPGLNIEGEMRMLAGVTRASPQKMEGRALLFGDEGAATMLGKFIAAFDKERRAVRLTCVPDNYEEHVIPSCSASRRREQRERFQRLVDTCADGFAAGEAKSFKREVRDRATEVSAVRDRSRSPKPPPSTGSA